MNRQKSFENTAPTLYLVPTPIGNLNEMTARAIEILQTVDVIACEDTRNSGQLLKKFDIQNHLIAYQNFNEESSTKGIIKLLEQGKNIALISDAGYPLINDPGQKVVIEAVKQNFNVVPISGCNAMLNALVASGLIVQPFLFIGFLPPSTHERNKKLTHYKDYDMTIIFYEAPHRITKMLKSCFEILGNRKCCIARELTKCHEEFLRGTISELLEISDTLKGEMVVIIEGNYDVNKKSIEPKEIIQMVQQEILSGMTTSDAIKNIAIKTGISKNKVYKIITQSKI